MLSFSAVEIKDREIIDPIMQQDGTISSTRTFSSLYIWGEHYQTCICQKDGILFLKACIEEDIITYHMPLGGDMRLALEYLEKDAAMHGMEYEISLITEDGKSEMDRLFPGKYRFEEMRSEFEYIYNAEDMISLRGNRFHGKRNFINRFKAEHDGRWEYREVDPETDADEITEFVRQWCNGRDNQNINDYRYEYSAISRALKHYNELDMRGGMIYLDGKLIAFTLATPQNEKAIDIIIEKADADIEGAYQMINNQFAARECAGFEYINREEDMGIEGLRHAKMSYHPVFLTAKYKAVPVK